MAAPRRRHGGGLTATSRRTVARVLETGPAHRADRRSEHHDLVGGHDVVGVVGGEEHRAPGQPPAEGLGQPVPRVGVEVAPDLVQQHQVPAVQHRPGDGHPVALAGAEGGAAFTEHGVEAVGQPARHLAEPGHRHRRIEGGRVGPRGRQRQVLARGSRRTRTAAGGPRRPGPARPPRRATPGRRRRRGCGPPRSGTSATQGVQGGRLAGSRRPDQRHPPARLESRASARRGPARPGRHRRRSPPRTRRRPRRPRAGPRHPTVCPTRRPGPRRSVRRRAGPRRRRGTRPRPGAAGGTPRGRRAAPTTATYSEVWPSSSRRPRTMATRPVPSPARSSSGERGQERDPQRAQGRAAEPLGRLGDLPAAVVDPSERPQGGQALDQLEQVGGQRGEAPPLPLASPRPPGGGTPASSAGPARRGRRGAGARSSRSAPTQASTPTGASTASTSWGR